MELKRDTKKMQFKIIQNAPKSVIVFGKIKTLTDKDEKIEALTYLGDKFFPTHEETVDEINRLLDRTEVFEITVDHMSGKIVQEK